MGERQQLWEQKDADRRGTDINDEIDEHEQCDDIVGAGVPRVSLQLHKLDDGHRDQCKAVKGQKHRERRRER